MVTGTVSGALASPGFGYHRKASERRRVRLRAWTYPIKGVNGHAVPVYFLDAARPENDPFDQSLTDNLYAGDIRYRLCQEAVLGMGGIAMLRAIGHRDMTTYHMNEGHSTLLAVSLLEEQTQGQGVRATTMEDIEAVRSTCVFTTHTPVPAAAFPANQGLPRV